MMNDTLVWECHIPNFGFMHGLLLVCMCPILLAGILVCGCCVRSMFKTCRGPKTAPRRTYRHKAVQTTPRRLAPKPPKPKSPIPVVTEESDTLGKPVAI